MPLGEHTPKAIKHEEERKGYTLPRGSPPRSDISRLFVVKVLEKKGRNAIDIPFLRGALLLVSETSSLGTLLGTLAVNVTLFWEERRGMVKSEPGKGKERDEEKRGGVVPDFHGSFLHLRP